MLRHSLKLTFVALQVIWMIAILPGHVRGMIVFGGDTTAQAVASDHSPKMEAASCCEEDSPLKAGQQPSSERKAKCAVCYQAHGYSVPPVFEIDLVPSGLCELRRLIEPTKLHRLLCRPTYQANGPPVCIA